LVGSADRKLDVRGLSGPDVTVGDVILGSATGALPVRARAYAMDGLSGMLEAYGRSPEQLQALSVTATIVPVGAGQPVATARAALRASTTPAAMRATKGFDLFARGDYGSAAAELGEALKLDQTNAATAFVLGWAYEEAGRHREAIGSWRAAATINPAMVPAH